MVDVEPAPSAPPTEPGAIGRSEARPVSRWAVGSLVCGIIGLLVSPVALAAVIVGVVGLRGLAAPDNRKSGRGLAIAGIWVGAGGLLLAPMYGLMIWGVVQTVAGVGRMEAIQDLRLLHGESVRFAEQNGRYPVHPAELLIETKGAFRAHRRVGGHGADPEPDVTLGGYDFADFDGTARATRAVTGALERIDESETSYLFGDCWFVRLDRPRTDGRIVFAWWPEPDREVAQVLMDSGDMREVPREEWSALWTDDAAARAEAGLAPLSGAPGFR